MTWLDLSSDVAAEFHQEHPLAGLLERAFREQVEDECQRDLHAELDLAIAAAVAVRCACCYRPAVEAVNGVGCCASHARMRRGR